MTPDEFLRRHAGELAAFPASDGEVTKLLTMIIKQDITDVDVTYRKGKPLHEVALAPAVFVMRHGAERLKRPTPDDARELQSIKFGLVYPLLKFKAAVRQRGQRLTSRSLDRRVLGRGALPEAGGPDATRRRPLMCRRGAA